jgi:F5/8 type C domain-containing protein
LQQAKKNGIYIMFTQDWLPGGQYGAAINQDCCNLFNFNNAQNLPAGAVRAYQLFYTDFITTLIDLGAPTDAIFSYELRNEFYFDTNYPPLSLTSGTVTTANDKSYDMSSKADREKMVEENLVYWIDNIRAAILKMDPTALVSIGFFVPQGPNPARLGDTRLAVSAPAIWQSQADFIDLHAYPGFELNLKQHVENFGVKGMQEKPIIMGEFGASVQSFSSVDAAAKALMNWQVESCQFGFDGWLLWTWDTSEQSDFYNALSGSGHIDQVLAPVNRPDPCAAGQFDFIENNIALGKNVRASKWLADQLPSNAVDGSSASIWNSGAGPTQWIEVDLGQPATITSIRLTVAQYPAGNTTHQIWVRGPNGSLQMVHEFKGNTTDNQILEFKPDPPLTGIQYIRIVTVASPSWVAWKEIEVIGK